MSEPLGRTDPARMVRVLHMIHWPRSGVGTVVADFIRSSSSGNARHSVVAFRGQESDLGIFAGLCDSVLLGTDRLGPRLRRALRHEMERVGPHVVHTHSFLPRLCARLMVASSIANVSTVHSVYPYLRSPDARSRIKRSLEGWSLRPVSRLVCVSREVAASLPPKWPQRGIRVIENGINVERIRSMAASRLGADLGTPGDLLIVSVGRLAQQKGYDLLVRALKKLRESVPVTLVIVGDGPERSALEQLTRELALNRWVSFLGHMENPFPVVAKADLFVSSSRYEGYGLALLEAMSLGVPVVATKTAGVPGLISDGVDGFLCPKMTPDSLAETIQSALSDQDVLAQVGARGSILARNRDWRHMWRRHASIYREVS